jgi:hypothetical protein
LGITDRALQMRRASEEPARARRALPRLIDCGSERGGDVVHDAERQDVGHVGGDSASIGRHAVWPVPTSVIAPRRKPGAPANGASQNL